ncbi:MAG: hypothetical protein U0Z53_15275 [Blastocatellia bacterium]
MIKAKEQTCKRPPERKTDPQPVTVVVADGKIRVDQEKLVLRVSGNQEAAWKCKTGTLDIRFTPNPKTSPFATNSFRAPKGGVALSGVPDRQKVSDAPYNYVIIVTQPDGTFIRQDLSVIVKA